jgi:hypothetical protein
MWQFLNLIWDALLVTALQQASNPNVTALILRISDVNE